MLTLFPFALGKGKARALWTGDTGLGDFAFALHGEFGEAARHPGRPPPLHARSAAAQRPALGSAEAVPGKGSPGQEKLPRGPSSSLRGLVPRLEALFWESVGGLLTVGAFVLEGNF